MKFWLLIPFLLQSLAITFDEFYFHIKRGLPKWERLGHPIDTFSLLLCLLFVLIFPYSSKNLGIYIGIAILSCLCVTKDEWVHKHHCNAKEQWLHALLFINHPLLLIALGCMWPEIHNYQVFLMLQSVMVFMFFIYQIIYWNFVWEER